MAGTLFFLDIPSHLWFIMRPMMIELRKYLEEHGRQAELARELGITVQAVNKWKQAPAKRTLQIERITGISRHILRPDIFGTKNGRVR
jgi:DNA-binding transcriptional regulator YdaS (Cro superfamily)